MEIKPQRRSSRMTKLPFWSKEHSSHNPGGTGYTTYVLFSSCEQLCPTSWVSWNGAWQGPHGSYQQPPGVYEQAPTLPPASLSPSTSGLCEKPKVSQFIVTTTAPFAKISSISAPHSQSPPVLGDTTHSGKRAPFQSSEGAEGPYHRAPTERASQKGVM